MGPEKMTINKKNQQNENIDLALWWLITLNTSLLLRFHETFSKNPYKEISTDLNINFQKIANPKYVLRLYTN